MSATLRNEAASGGLAGGDDWAFAQRDAVAENGNPSLVSMVLLLVT